MVLPTLITLADIEARVPSELGVQQLSDVALHILQLLSPFAHTLTCTLGRTAPGPDGVCVCVCGPSHRLPHAPCFLRWQVADHN